MNSNEYDEVYKSIKTAHTINAINC